MFQILCDSIFHIEIFKLGNTDLCKNDLKLYYLDKFDIEYLFY